MRRRLLFLGVLALAGGPALAHGPSTLDFYLTVDVPADVPLPVPSTTVLPWEIARHRTPGPTYTKAVVPAFVLPPPSTIDALHLTGSGNWLFSVADPIDHPSVGPSTLFLPGDVVRFDPAAAVPFDFTFEFCGTIWGLADGVNVDAVFVGGQTDAGALILSFDAPTSLPPTGATVYHPGDLLEFTRTGAGCAGWTFSGVYFDFDTSALLAAGMSVEEAATKNVSGADERGSIADGTYQLLLTFDVETDLLPPAGAGPTLLPGDVVAWDPAGVAFSLLHRDPAWPLTLPGPGTSARINSLSLLAPPGTIPGTGSAGLMVTKNTPSGSSLTLTWSESCSAGAEDYGIHEGTIGVWYNHDNIVCTDSGTPLTETIAPAVPGASNYYLVVPWNPNDEGSYGIETSTGAILQRPVSTPLPNCETNATGTQEIGCP